MDNRFKLYFLSFKCGSWIFDNFSNKYFMTMGLFFTIFRVHANNFRFSVVFCWRFAFMLKTLRAIGRKQWPSCYATTNADHFSDSELTMFTPLVDTSSKGVDRSNRPLLRRFFFLNIFIRITSTHLRDVRTIVLTSSRNNHHDLLRWSVFERY